MAKKAKEEKTDEAPVEKELDSLKLSKLLIKEFNKDSKVKIAWCLATDDDNPTDVRDYISTGSTLLDYIISNRRNGGVPVGKITEFCGEEASGKSLICAHLIAECQRRGGIAIYIDTENAANPDFLVRLGVDIQSLVYLQPGTCEEVGEAIEKSILMARTRAPDKLVLVIWDSTAGTPTRMELEGAYDISMNVQLEKSKVLSQMMKKITETVGRDNVCLVFTNHLKTKIGVMYGDPMGTPGGKAVPYAASVRVRLNRGGQEKDDAKGDVTGIRTVAKTIKCRLGPPLRRCEFEIKFADGIDDVGSWFEYLHAAGEIEKADGWCYLTSYPSGKLETKGANEGKDRGVKFREKGWTELVTTKQTVDCLDEKMGEVKEVEVDLKPHVLDLLEKHLVKRYDKKNAVDDVSLDAESLMDNEAVAEIVQGVQNG